MPPEGVHPPFPPFPPLYYNHSLQRPPTLLFSPSHRFSCETAGQELWAGGGGAYIIAAAVAAPPPPAVTVASTCRGFQSSQVFPFLERSALRFSVEVMDDWQVDRRRRGQKKNACFIRIIQRLIVTSVLYLPFNGSLFKRPPHL